MSLNLREATHSRPASRGSFRQHVETIKAPCASLFHYSIHFTRLPVIKAISPILYVTSLKNKLELDWLIVVIVPQSDFTAQIDANTRTTILLTIAALIVAILIGIFTAQWVATPVLRLNRVASDLAEGQWDKTVVE